MEKLSRTELLTMCKDKGFVRYSSLNKHNLIDLLKTGSHKQPKQRSPWRYISESGMGVLPHEFERDGNQYTITIKDSDKFCDKYVSDDIIRYLRDGYCAIRGINLEGLFNSRWVPPKQTTVYENTYNSATDDSDSDNEPIRVEITYKQYGAWVIPKSELPSFKAFFDSLKPKHNPKSLFDSAAHVVNSRKITQYIPKHLLKRIKAVGR